MVLYSAGVVIVIRDHRTCVVSYSTAQLWSILACQYKTGVVLYSISQYMHGQSSYRACVAFYRKGVFNRNARPQGQA